MKEFKTTRTKPQLCLNCGELVDAATSIYHKNTPKKGSVTICFRCGHIMVFDAQLNFRELTDEEKAIVVGREDIMEIQRARQAVRIQRAIDETLRNKQ
jgi:hypothetical protein